MTYRGFSMIELMIVVAIIGILAVIAIPSYQRYVQEAKLTEILEYGDLVKTELAEIYETTGKCPHINDTAIPKSHPIPIVASVSTAWDRNPCRDWFEIYLEVDGDADWALKPLDGGRIMFRGQLQKGGQITWQCGYSRFTPYIGPYLPSTCRNELI